MRRMTDKQAIQYHMARFCWTRRNEQTPSKKTTWGGWFEKRYGVSLNEYAKAQADGKQKAA